MTIEPGFLKPFLSALEGSGYAQFSTPGDRHGSWEWPFYKDTGDLTLFVIFAATLEDGRESLQAELWIGAQSNRGFIRKLVQSRRARGEDLTETLGKLARHTEKAIRQASCLAPLDLTK